MGRYSYANTPTVEESLDLSISWLKRHGYLVGYKSGGMLWKQYGKESSVSFKVDTENMYIQFQYNSNGEPLDYKAWLSCSQPNFGGKRYYFNCPIVGCSKRVSVLYLVGKYFGCRKCHKIQYRSSRKSGTRYSKLKKSLEGSSQRESMVNEMLKSGDFTALEVLMDGIEP